MAETALAEPQAEAPASGNEPTRQREGHTGRPADVLRQAEVQGRNTPIDKSQGERRNNIREKLVKFGVTLAMLAAIGALIIGTHGLGIAPLKGWLTTHHLTSFSSLKINRAPTVIDHASKTAIHDIDKGFKYIGKRFK